MFSQFLNNMSESHTSRSLPLRL